MFSTVLGAAVALALIPSVASAQTPPPATEPAPAPAAPVANPMARARYSLPWNLRSAIAANSVRADFALALQGHATSTATIVTGGGRPFAGNADLGFYGRLGMVTNAPDGADTRSALVNPLVFGLWSPQIARGFRLPVFVGATIPIGPGSDVSAPQRAAFGSGIYTRQAMDNAMFASNYFTVMAGAGLMWMGSGLTAQAEFTVLQLTRVWGETVDADASRTNFTMGAHVGYQLIPWLTVSVEAHYQHWLSDPAAVVAAPPAGNAARRSQLTLGGGLRANLPVGSMMLRPGVAFFMPTGGYMNNNDYKIAQFDLAVLL